MEGPLLERTAIVSRHVGRRLAAGLETLGVEVWLRYWQDHPVRARDAGWTARTLDQMWAVRRALRPRIDPSVTHLWAIGLAVGLGFSMVFLMIGFVFYRIGQMIMVSPSVI